jgi:hypothetical protein
VSFYNVTSHTDTTINANVSISAYAYDGTATITVNSRGANGMGYQGVPNANSPASNQGYAQVRSAPTFTVTYRAYIPVDHVISPTPCLVHRPEVSSVPFFAAKIYKGAGGQIGVLSGKRNLFASKLLSESSQTTGARLG